MPSCVSSCETTRQQRAPIHRCGAERSYARSERKSVGKRETPVSNGLLSPENRTYPIFRLTDSLSINILFTVRENNPLSLAQRDTSQMPMEYRAYIYAYVYVCLNMCVKRLYTLPSWAISPWGE